MTFSALNEQMEMVGLRATIRLLNTMLEAAEARATTAEQELAEVKEERVDWARRFKLNDVTPWEWMSRATAAEAREAKDAARLDFLERNQLGVWRVEDDEVEYSTASWGPAKMRRLVFKGWCLSNDDTCTPHPTPRAAIDAALQQVAPK